MARSESVRRWLEELRYETESYDPQMQLQSPQEGSVSWRYARVTWSPEALQNVQSAEVKSENVPANTVESVPNKVRQCVQKKEEEIHSEEPDQARSRLQTVSIAPGTVNNRRLNFSSSSLASKSPDLVIRRKVLPGIPINTRPLSHQQPKQSSYLHKEYPLPLIIKEGSINRVKLMNIGSKSGKHWKTGMHAVLTDKGLNFAEDSDSLILMKSGAKLNLPRERIDLTDGARVIQDTDRSHSSKKNVLVISNKEGYVVVLMQNDDPQKSEEWYKEITKVITKHSSEHSPQFESGSTNTKSKLNWFFKKRPNKELLMNQGIYKNESIFGNNLEKLYELSEKKRPVPAFVSKCTEMLETPPHVCSVGLYRTSGNLSHIQKLRLRVDQEDANALDNESIATDSDVLAGALKLFFRELQVPLVPYDIYLRLSDACTKSNMKERFQQSKEALKKLSEAHYKTLALLCQHLLKITAHEKQNQMSAANLGIVWGPSFTWPDEGAGTGTRALHLYTDVNRVVQYLIEESNTLF